MNNRNQAATLEPVATDPPSNSQVQLLRSRVEAELKKPAVVLVTSAHAGDGKSLTANSLATCFAKSGHRTALVNGNWSGAGNEAAAYPSPATGSFALLELPPESDSAVSREGLENFVNTVRHDYDYAIVDAGPYLNSNSAMALTQLVDGILLTVRVGRASSDEDEMMVRMVEHFRGNVVGVVAADGDAIAEFARSRPPLAVRAPARPRKTERKAAQALVSSVMCAAMLLMLDGSSQASQSAALGSALRNVPAQVVTVVENVRSRVMQYREAYPALSFGNREPGAQSLASQQRPAQADSRSSMGPFAVAGD